MAVARALIVAIVPAATEMMPIVVAMALMPAFNACRTAEAWVMTAVTVSAIMGLGRSGKTHAEKNAS